MSSDSTLFDVLIGHASGSGERAGVSLWNPALRDYESVTYRELVCRAFAFGGRLHDAGYGDGGACLIACHTPYATLVAFYGAISAGAAPMIFPMPTALGSNEALVERIRHWGARFDPPPVLVLEDGREEKFHEGIPGSMATIRVGDSPGGHWDRRDGPVADRRPGASDIAYFQTTSSSTGDHKAVAVTHGNVLSNVHGIRATVPMADDERMISWVPLYHDMGLVGAALFTLCHGYRLFLMTPTQFIKRPALWLRGMSDARCTLTTAPNFGYDYCTRLVSDRDAAGLDLFCMKHFFIGAEPIRASTLRDFVNRFARAGVDCMKMRPAYGLAESTLATTVSRPSRKQRFVFLDPDGIAVNQRVRVVAEARFEDVVAGRFPEEPVAICTAGRPIEGMAVGLVDEEGRPVHAAGCAGEIVIQGTSVAAGYVGGGRLERFTDGKAATGDMGVVIDGELFIIERIKNIIIRHGENFLVSAMEQRLADVFGVLHDNVAVFQADIHDPLSDIVVLIEKHPGLEEARIDEALANLPPEGFPIDVVLLHRSRVIPRTTSGKKRHFLCRRLYHRGELRFQQQIEVTPDRIAAASSRRVRDSML